MTVLETTVAAAVGAVVTLAAVAIAGWLVWRHDSQALNRVLSEITNLS